MVVATYNVAPYIEAFFDSLVNQEGGIDDLEVIVVNDGSTDHSGLIAQEWSTRYPDTIKYIEQYNQGVCAARNAGLAQATGTWICFPDPDDFLSSNYLAEFRSEVAKSHIRPLIAISAPLIYFHEATGEYTNNHPLRTRFKRYTRRLNSTEMGTVLLPHTSSTFMRRMDIIRLGLTFDERVRPSFEDAHFIISLLIQCPGRCVSFLPKPNYYYRKRQAEDSIVDRVTTDRDWYGAHLRNAYLSLFSLAHMHRGYIPTFVQASVLFSLLSKLRHLTGPQYDPSLLSPAEQSEFLNDLQDIMEQIDVRVLRSRKIPRLNRWQKQALLERYKGIPASSPWIIIEQYNAESGTVLLNWVVAGQIPRSVEVKVNGKTLTSRQECETGMLFNLRYAQACRQEIPFMQGQTLTASLDGKPLQLFAQAPSVLHPNRRWLGPQVRYERLRKILKW